MSRYMPKYILSNMSNTFECMCHMYICASKEDLFIRFIQLVVYYLMVQLHPPPKKIMQKEILFQLLLHICFQVTRYLY